MLPRHIYMPARSIKVSDSPFSTTSMRYDTNEVGVDQNGTDDLKKTWSSMTHRDWPAREFPLYSRPYRLYPPSGRASCAG
jgi:hypothetical protein